MAKKPKKSAKKPPAHQAKVGGIHPPPVETRFKPGISGNPAGRPCAGAAIREWFNAMQSWSQFELLEIINDQKSPAAKVAAARCWFDASSILKSNSGVPIAGAEVDRILDRTIGKAQQAIDVTTKGEKLPGLNDFSKFTIDELTTFETLLRKANESADATTDTDGVG